MNDEIQITKTPTKENESKIKSRPRETTESLEMVLAQLDNGNGIANKLTEGHIDKIIDQRGDIIEKVHTDKKLERKDNKFYVITGLVFSLIVLFGIGSLAPQFLGEAITGLLAGTGGLGLGFGLAMRKQ